MSDQFPPVRSSDDAATLRAAGRSSQPMPAPEITVPDTHIGDYLRVIYKRRWVAMTTIFLVVVTVIIYTFTATPIYEAHAQLLIEVENPNVVSFKEVIEQDKATTDYYQTQYRILQSRTLARRTLSKLNLWGVVEKLDVPHFMVLACMRPRLCPGSCMSTTQLSDPFIQIRLAGLVVDLLPGEPEPLGLENRQQMHGDERRRGGRCRENGGKEQREG